MTESELTRALWHARMQRAKYESIAWGEHSALHGGTYTIDGTRMDASCNKKHQRLLRPTMWTYVWGKVHLLCEAKYQRCKETQ